MSQGTRHHLEGGRPQCSVCGCADLELDEVEMGERLGLGECRRCGHRWTASVAAAPSRTYLVGESLCCEAA